MPDYRPRRVIQKLVTASMVADELGIPDSTARTLMERVGWKYGAVHIKGLRRSFIRRRDHESPYARREARTGWVSRCEPLRSRV